jgi:tRNA-dihydrouridine synthase 3
MGKMAQIIENEVSSSFIDLNCGCPIDLVTNRGCGSALMTKPSKLCDIVSSMTKYLSRPVTVKIRTGWDCKEPTAHKLIPKLQQISKGRIAAIMIHGRSRQQRYTKSANWDYILEAARSQSIDLPRIPIIGNGDIFSFEDWQSHQRLMETHQDNADDFGLCNCAMIGRGALIKPWLPQEIKENRHIDISASERLEMLKRFCNYGLEHWGSDNQGISTVRRFLLEWLSFLCRYVPSGLVERTQKMQQKPVAYFGRCDLETLLSSTNPQDWVKISELLLGPVPCDFEFTPKHKSNGYAASEADMSNG